MLHRTMKTLVLVGVAAGALALGCGDNRTPQPTHAAYDAGGLPQLSCVPNLDGRIDASELGPALGVPVHYLVSPAGKTRTVDLTGSVDAQGHTVWDFGADYADDQVATISASAPTGKWYAGSFPGATFVAPLDAGDTIEGAYAYSQAGITLLGIASRDPDGPGGKTLLVYDQPVTVYRFPIVVGDAYVSVGNLSNATLRGQPYAGKDTYQVSVDGSGEVVLHDYTFTQALRVRTTATVEPSAGAAVVTRQTSFLFECFGEIVRATSQTGEQSDDFTTAAELRRLGQ